MNCDRSFRRNWITSRAVKYAGKGMGIKEAKTRAREDWEQHQVDCRPASNLRSGEWNDAPRSDPSGRLVQGRQR